ncbi:hypothetical protein [Trichococcus ilyis]|jgi:hypothetical protein|uniref:hypothetical protein n=1 Tax=Trichococcus ilyis TaxID=640938 RepID=UPI00138EF26D|nr:hypothetical protein [Trichococcus ilyis]
MPNNEKTERDSLLSRFFAVSGHSVRPERGNGLSKQTKYGNMRRLEFREEAENESIVYW